MCVNICAIWWKNKNTRRDLCLEKGRETMFGRKKATNKTNAEVNNEATSKTSSKSTSKACGKSSTKSCGKKSSSTKACK